MCEWKRCICIAAAIIVILMHGVHVYEWVEMGLKGESDAGADPWSFAVMDILFLIVATLLIYGVVMGNRMCMLPFIVIGILYVIIGTANLIEDHSERRLIEAGIDIFVTVIAILVFIGL